MALTPNGPSRMLPVRLKMVDTTDEMSTNACRSVFESSVGRYLLTEYFRGPKELLHQWLSLSQCEYAHRSILTPTLYSSSSPMSSSVEFVNTNGWTSMRQNYRSAQHCVHCPQEHSRT
jgi:hypothetical protein